MKAKVILYGWAISWIGLLAGPDTIEYGNELVGWLLIAVWCLFSCLMIENKKACDREMKRLDAWTDRTFGCKMSEE